MDRSAVLAGLILLVLILAPPVAAIEMTLWSNGKPVCSEPRYDTLPVAASDGTGGMIVAWIDYRNGSYDKTKGWQNSDVYAQRVDSRGNPRWGTDGVLVCNTSNDQTGVQIVSDGAGGAIIVWVNTRNYSIYAQRISPSGKTLWPTPDGVAICTARNYRDGISMLPDGYGGAIVAWNDLRGSAFDTYAQRINHSGQVLWTSNGIAVCTANLDQYGVVLTSAGTGVIAAWYDYRNATWDSTKQAYVNSDVFAQKISPTGAVEWAANGVGVCTQPRDQYNCVIATDGAGGAILAWTDCRIAQTDPSIYAQRLAPTGAPVWQADGIPVCVADYEQYVSAVATDCAGGAYVVWEDYRYDAGGDIYMQQVTATGQLWPSPVVVAAYSSEYGASAVSDLAGNVVVAYKSWNGTDTDLMAQKVNPAGVKLWNPTGEPVSTGPGNQPFAQNVPGICVSTSGLFFVWDDDRFPDPTGATYIADIYAQRSGEPPVATSVQQVRAMPDNTAFTLPGVVVTAKCGGFSYVEDPTRTAGIQVLEQRMFLPLEGYMTSITGRVTTVNGERRIVPASAADLGPTTMPAPFGIGLRGLGGAPVSVGGEVRIPGVAGGIGANNVGLLVKVWGTVSWVADYFDPDWPCFSIVDGSGLVDPYGHKGVRVYGDVEAWGGTVGSFVTVTGASSTLLAPGETIPARVLRATAIELPVQ